MNTLTALLLLASHITENSTADDGLNELIKHCAIRSITYGDQNTKNATLVTVRILVVRLLPTAPERANVDF